MSATKMMTQSMDLRKVRVTDAADTSFPSRVVTRTPPSGDGVIQVLSDVGGDGDVQNSILLIPFGGPDDNDVFNMRVIGWRRAMAGNLETAVWVPILLAQFACTVGGSTGAANGYLVAADRLADTITVTFGNAGISLEAVSPANDLVAHAIVDLKGSHRVEVTFDDSTGSPTAMNALYALL